MVKTDAKTERQIINTITAIPERELKAYAAVLFWTACRAGELLPYQHYKLYYKKDNGRIMTDEYYKPLIDRREATNITYGINVEDIEIDKEKIHFKKIPVFKTRGETQKEGLIWKVDHPLYDHIISYINERKAVMQSLRDQGNPKAVYLFEAESPEEIERYTWRVTKRLYIALKKADPTFKIHTLRVSRATIAGDASGDPFYVQSITGHKSIQMASEYTKSRNFLDKARRYERGVDDE
jgi:hypothetical protein